MPAGLLALAISAFGIGTTEFIMMGLLPEIAAAFHVSIPTAGDLISGYALGVVVGAPLLTAASTRLSRRTVLLGLMAVFTVGNLFAAVAQSYTMLLAARVLTGLPHGAFFGVGSVVAAGMVPSNKRATAISMMFAGLAVANVIGVPAGTHTSPRSAPQLMPKRAQLLRMRSAPSHPVKTSPSQLSVQGPPLSTAVLRHSATAWHPSAFAARHSMAPW